ncbi:MAG: ribosome small subunit-dependent GTPase A [Chloroflexota bacterium]
MSNQLNGLVVREQSGFYWVEVPEENGKIYQTRLRGKLTEEAQSADIAAIGDRVSIQVSENEDLDNIGTIIHVEGRKNVLSRAVRTTGNRGAGAPERQQVLMANADQALFVFAATHPNPNLRMLDRFLITGEASGIDDLYIVVNKIDLVPQDIIENRFADYNAMGYPVLMTSAKDSLGIEPLQEVLAGKISVFTGPSGVGKTSLLNTIQPDLGRTVKEVSQMRKEGVHTTRDSALIKMEQGGYIADTPGIRNLSIWDVQATELDGYFRDMAPYVPDCKFSNCSHRNEPGCAVMRAVMDGHISKRRYKHYLILREELDAALAVY